MDGKYSDWDWDFDSTDQIWTDKSQTDTQWCEVSLGSESEQELRGRLQFRNFDRTSSESSETVEEEIKVHSQFAIAEATSTAGKPQGISLAYHLGMMVVSGAANAVNSVADGGKRNRDTMKQLRKDLEEMHSKYERVVQESENLKKWIVYYENIKTNLENQIDECNQTLLGQNQLSQHKIKDKETEIESMRIKVDAAAKQNEETLSDLEEARRTIARLNKELQKQNTLAARPRHDTLSQTIEPSTDSRFIHTSQQTDLLCNSSADSKLTAETQRKERQLQDIAKALKLADSRNDKLRNQLMTSLESMKSHSFQMKSSRVALEMALNEASDLKVLLNDEKRHTEEKDKELYVVREKYREITKELERHRDLVKTIEKEINVLNEDKKKKSAELASVKTQQVSFRKSMNLDKLADSVVTDALHGALIQHLHVLHSRKVARLQTTCEKNAKSAEASQNFLQNQIKNMIESHENDLLEAKTQSSMLALNVEELEKHLYHTEETEKNLTSALNLEKSSQKHLTFKLDDIRRKDSTELERLHSQILSLKEERSTLLSKLSQTAIVHSASSVQTRSFSYDDAKERKVDTDIASEINLSQSRAADFKKTDIQMFEELEKIKRLQEDLELKKKEIYGMKSLNRQLQLVIESDRKATYEKDCALIRMEDHYRQLEWYYRGQQAKIFHLRRQNVALRQYLNNETKSIAQHTTEDLTQNNYLDVGLVSENESLQNSNRNSPNTQVDTELTEKDDGNQYIDQEQVSGTKLDTIMEADEKSSCDHSSSRSSCVELKSDASADRVITPNEPNCNGSLEVTKSLHHSSKAENGSARKRRSAGRKKVTPTGRSNNPKVNLGCDSALCLPIWRRENPLNAQYMARNTSEEPCIKNRDDDVINDDVFASATEQPSNIHGRRIGVPMSEENFNRIIESNVATHPLGCGDVESFRDDGYVSSTNSSQKPQSCLSPRSALSSNSENTHYYVTFAGTTFDLASFSLATMRDVTSTCGALSTAEGMKAFLDFLANKAIELDNDSYWKNRHNLGKPEDWLSLKEFYC